MQLRTYAQILAKGWWLILLALLVSVSVAVVITNAQTPIYQTSSTFLVSPGRAFKSVGETLYSWDLISRREGAMATYVEIATSRTILNATYSELMLTESQLKNISVASEMLPSTNIIHVTVEAGDPQLAKVIADAIGQKIVEYVKSLSEVYELKPLDTAFVPVQPYKPQRTQNLLLAILLGLVVGIGTAFLRDYLWSGETRVVTNFIHGEAGVFNQRYFSQRLGEELSRAKRHRYPLSIALLGIDHIGTADNSAHLPNLRNGALRRVGLFLKQSLRSEDLVARFDGDKFAVLFPDTSEHGAEQAILKLQNNTEWNVPESTEGVKLNLNITAGIATYNFDGQSCGDLLVDAEKSLRRARESGCKIYPFQELKGPEAFQSKPASN